MKKQIALLLSFVILLASLPVLPYAEGQSPRIVETLYPTDDVVIADIVATEAPYGADSTGGTDASAVIQRALDDCAAAGGGASLRSYCIQSVDLPYNDGVILRNVCGGLQSGELLYLLLQPFYTVRAFFGKLTLKKG